MIIFKYILKEYFKYVLGTITLCTFLMILFNFIQLTTKYFQEFDPSAKHIAMFYFYQLPAIFVQVVPIASLLASVIAMVLLSRSNEVTAMRAAGMGPISIGLPLAAGGLFLSLASFGLNEFVVPKFAQKKHFVQKVLIEGETSFEIADGARWVRDGEKLFNFRDYEPFQQKLLQVKLITLTDDFQVKSLTEAGSAVYQRDRKVWYVEKPKTITFGKNQEIVSVDQLPAQELSLPIEPKKLKNDRRLPNELSSRELVELIERGERSGAETLAYRVDLHMKFSFPLAALVVSLIGLKFGYKSERTTETVKGILLAFALGISYWFVLSSGRALGRHGDLPPFLAAWMANFVITVIIAGQLMLTQRKS